MDLIKQLEGKYQDKKIKFEFLPRQFSSNEFREEYDFYLNNSSNVLLKEILNILKRVIPKKETKSFEIHALPGLSKLLHTKNSLFRADLEKLQSRF